MTPQEQELLLLQISQQTDFIVNHVSVNGSKGLQPVLTDIYRRQVEHGEAIKELKLVTEPERAKQQLVKGIRAFIKVHPFLSWSGGILLAAAGGSLGKHLIAWIETFFN